MSETILTHPPRLGQDPRPVVGQITQITQVAQQQPPKNRPAAALFWLAGEGDPVTATNRIAVLTAAAVILAAGVLGYTALYDLFVSIGLFSPWLGVFFPLLFDLAEVTAAVIVLNATLQGERDRFAWLMVLLFTGLGILANIAHAAQAYHTGRIDAGQAIIALFATALFPLSVALVTHLLKSAVTRQIHRGQAVTTLARLTAQGQQAAAELDKITRQIETAQGKLDALRQDIKAARVGQNARTVAEMNQARQDKIEARRADVLARLTTGETPAEIAESLGFSIKTIRRDIKELNGAAKAAQGVTL